MANAAESRNDEYLARARELVRELEAGNLTQADALLDDLSSMRESKLFMELGKLTRTLHEALNNFQMDTRLAQLSQEDMPDARNRLRYVVTKTEESAHRTLKAVEESLPLAKRLGRSAIEHQQLWDKFLRREMDVAEFRALTQTLRGFLGNITDDANALHDNLSEVRMAQEYQDLTGQVIQRVVEIVQEVEEGLVEMIRVCGQSMHAGSKGAVPKRPEGPQIDPKKPNVLTSQDDVDQLLSNLGF